MPGIIFVIYKVYFLDKSFKMLELHQHFRPRSSEKAEFHWFHINIDQYYFSISGIDCDYKINIVHYVNNKYR